MDFHIERIRRFFCHAAIDPGAQALDTGIDPAPGYRLVEQGHSVLFAPTYKLVQDLLAAKRDLELPRALHKLDRFDVLILDDLGYLKHRADEAEVLFTLIAERYERRSIIVTSNMVFSQWEEIFQSPMATAAAIDRIVHHSVITEFDVTSYRTAEAQNQSRPDAPPSAQAFAVTTRNTAAVKAAHFIALPLLAGKSSEIGALGEHPHGPDAP